MLFERQENLTLVHLLTGSEHYSQETHRPHQKMTNEIVVFYMYAARLWKRTLLRFSKMLCTTELTRLRVINLHPASKEWSEAAVSHAPPKHNILPVIKDK